MCYYIKQPIILFAESSNLRPRSLCAPVPWVPGANLMVSKCCELRVVPRLELKDRHCSGVQRTFEQKVPKWKRQICFCYFNEQNPFSIAKIVSLPSSAKHPFVLFFWCLKLWFWRYSWFMECSHLQTIAEEYLVILNSLYCRTIWNINGT